jgi:hypothetical protein
MLPLRYWLLLCGGNLAALVVLSIIGNTLESRGVSIDRWPVIPRTALRGFGLLALVGFVVSVPPTMMKLFIAGQLKIGNADHPMVGFLQRHETGVVRGVWIVWLAGTLIALPFLLRAARGDPAQ